jgi:hypothetical protein
MLQLTPDRDGDPHFVPVAVMEAMPVLASPLFIPEQMLTPKSPVLVPVQMECGEGQVLPFVQKLRDLEQCAKAEMAAWDPKYMPSQGAEDGAASAVSAKRKASEMDSDSSDYDDEADEDGEDEVAPLDPHSQKRPKLPIYHPGFKLTEELTLGTLSNFVEFIRQAGKGYSDEELTHLWNEVMRSKTIPYQGAVKLAVAGDTGAGKSALLNAILGVLNLTIEVREAIHVSEHELTSFPERRRRCVYLCHHGVPSSTFDSSFSIRR